MKTLIIHAADSNIQKIQDFLNSLKVSFEVSKEENYNAEFVEMIEENKKALKEGNYKKITLDDIWK